mmetsp:Transcript_34444/g.94799  ORF Transcript_34444/g.94799 Transcript_34444/m.94799 type:complete len:124 (+) Transcript_34444:938-1309(+)
MRNEQAQGRDQRRRKCCTAGPGGITSSVSQMMQRDKRAAPSGKPRAWHASLHAPRVDLGSEGCGPAFRSEPARIRQRANGKNQNRWSSAEEHPQKPTASGHDAGHASTSCEETTCTPVHSMAP